MDQNRHSPSDVAQPKIGLRLKFLGVGGAGCHIAEYLQSAGFEDVTFIAVDTDAQALAQCQAAQQYHLGAGVTRGLGIGGDPELGWAAAEKEAAQLRPLCAGADIVFLAAGLGRGTGTGAAPVLARVAREAGALVLAFAVFPFACEGQRRQEQAQQGLGSLKSAADGVICLPNQQLAKLVSEKTSLVETFRLSHELLAQGLRGIWRLLNRPGLIQVDFAHLASVLRGRHSESYFAMAEGLGPHRAAEAVQRMLASPLLGEGQLLAEAEAVLVSLAGGLDLSLAEVNQVMEPINQHCPRAQVTLGATLDESLSDRLEVTLIASSKNHPTESASPSPAAKPEPDSELAGLDLRASLEPETPVERPAPRFLPQAPSLSPEQTERLAKQQAGANPRLRKAFPRWRQGQLPLEIVSKGRFEKSEPTIHRGEDLDVPTFKRRGLVLN